MNAKRKYIASLIFGLLGLFLIGIASGMTIMEYMIEKGIKMEHVSIALSITGTLFVMLSPRPDVAEKK